MEIIKRFKTNFINASYYMGSSLIVALVGVLLNPIYAQNLSHADYAVLGYYASFNVFLLPFLHFNLFSYYSRQYYFLPETQRDSLGNTILLSSILVGFGTLMVFLISFYIYHRVANVSFDFFPYAILTFLDTYILNVCTFYKTKLRIERKAKQFANFSIVVCAVTTLLTLLLVVYFKWGATGKLVAAIIAACIFATYSLSKSVTKWEIDKGMLKKGVKFTWPLVLGNFLWYFFSGIDKALLEKGNDIINYGLYCVGLSIATYMSIFFSTLSSTFLPDLYQSISQKRHKKMVGIVGIIVGIVALANLSFIVVAPLVIDLLTAGRYVDASAFARIFCIYNILYAFYVMVENVMIGYGFTKQILWMKIVGAVLSVAVYYALICQWNFYGAAWGQSIVIVLLAGMMIGYILFTLSKTKNYAKN